MKEVLAVTGASSELARLAPVLRTLRDQYACVIRPRLMCTGEKPERVWATGALFGVVPERQHVLSTESMSHADLSWEISNAVGHELDSRVTDLVLVQGNSWTSMLASQQAFLRNIPVVHIDGVAGRFAENDSSLVRSNQRMISAIAAFHCVPDRSVVDTLRSFGQPAYEIGVTGSTAVDSARMVLANGLPGVTRVKPCGESRSRELCISLSEDGTSREVSTELGFALATLAHDFPDIKIRVVVPGGRGTSGLFISILGSLKNVDLTAPGDHYSYLKMLALSELVLTNSADTAEDAISMARPVLFMANEEFLLDGADAMNVKIVSPTQDSIVNSIEMAMAEHRGLHSGWCAEGKPAIGDGKASVRIAQLLSNWARNRVLTAHAFEPYDTRLQELGGIAPSLSTSAMH